MSRVHIKCGSQEGVFGFGSATTSEELKNLLRLEFGISAQDELSLCQIVKKNFYLRYSLL